LADACVKAAAAFSNTMSWLSNFWKVMTEPPPGFGSIKETTHTNFTPRAQQVLALARKEADRLNHNYIGTEHLLLGLIMLGQGVAVNVLAKLGADSETVRSEVEKQVGIGSEPKMFGNVPYTPRTKKVLGWPNRKPRRSIIPMSAPSRAHFAWTTSRRRWLGWTSFDKPWRGP
jgi:hypothetical protein